MKPKRSLANIPLHAAIPLNHGLFFALDEKGDGRLHDNSRFHGYTTTWFTNARGECWRVRTFGNLPDKTMLCASHQDALLTLIRLAQTKAKPRTAVKEEPPPFGAVRFDGSRLFDGMTNEARATEGKTMVALFYLVSARESGWKHLMDYAATVNLDEVPELPLAEMLANLMHYCHRDHIHWYGAETEERFEGVIVTAQRRFNEQSGGAAL